MKDAREMQKRPTCTICKLDDDVRSGVELLCCISAASWNACAKRVRNTFGVATKPETLRRHMCEHELTRAVAEQGVIIDSIKGASGAPGIFSAENMLQTLLVQGMLDLAKGKIRCKTPAELIAVMSALQNVQAKRNAAALIEQGDISGFYAAMAAYGTAIRDTVSTRQLDEIVAKANALGAHFDISRAEFEEADQLDIDAVLSQAVADYKKGGGGARRDLLESGALDGLSLPD